MTSMEVGFLSPSLSRVVTVDSISTLAAGNRRLSPLFHDMNHKKHILLPVCNQLSRGWSGIELVFTCSLTGDSCQSRTPLLPETSPSLLYEKGFIFKSKPVQRLKDRSSFPKIINLIISNNCIV